jgi:hypothetical protein
MRRALLVASTAMLVAGCGTEPSSFQGSDDALRDASTSRIEWKMEGEGVPEWASMRSTGSFDYAKNRAELVMHGESDSAPDARMILVGRDSYMGIESDGTMHWLKHSVQDATGADRFLPGSGGTSPDRLLKELIDSSKKVETLGSEEIRGVTATHYRAHLDKAKLGTDGNSDGAVVVDAWIDEQGLPRRIRIPFGGETDSGFVIDLFDFGVPVDVEAPPADEVVSEDEFDKLMDEQCAGADKAPEEMNPLCAIFGGTMESGGTITESSSPDRQFSPTETIPTTEGE